MKKFTKEQTQKFDELYKDMLNWGEGIDCCGIFQEFGGCLEDMVTCVEDGYITFYEVKSYSKMQYSELAGVEINRKAKGIVKKLVLFLSENNFKDIPYAAHGDFNF